MLGQQRPGTGRLLPLEAYRRRFTEYALRAPLRDRDGFARNAD